MLQNKPRNHIGLLILFTFLVIFLTTAPAQGNDVPYEHSGYGIPLKFYPLKVGMDIPLHSLIEMPYLSEEGFLSIEFSRGDVEEKFIRDLFYGEDKNVVSNIHPFAHRSIEPILTRDKLILNIYSGVILHLRNDMKFFPNYKTFKSETVTGKVVKVSGKVRCSFDHFSIKARLKDVFVQWHGTSAASLRESKIYEQPDGSYIHIIPFDEKRDLPLKYPPKILE